MITNFYSAGTQVVMLVLYIYINIRYLTVTHMSTSRLKWATGIIIYKTNDFFTCSDEYTRKSKYTSYNSLTFSDVEIEEITVQYCLHAASNNSDKVEEAIKVVSVDPVQQVEGPVGTESEQVMAGDCLSRPSLTDHEQLGQDGH